MKKTISILLCLTLLTGLLAGCGAAYDPEAYIPTGDALEGTAPVEDEQIPVQEETKEQAFSLAYYPDRSMNPLETTDFTNRALMPLVYQGLFAVNQDYEAIPILCKSYSVSADMMTYEFDLDPKATFSDGTKVKAEDVVESLLAAMNSDYYGGRFRHVGMVAAVDAANVLSVSAKRSPRRVIFGEGFGSPLI